MAISVAIIKKKLQACLAGILFQGLFHALVLTQAALFEWHV